MRNNLYTSIMFLAGKKLQGLVVLLLLLTVLISQGQNLNSPNKPGPLGTYVNTLSGNLFIPRTDMLIAARGFDLDVRFSYNSFLLHNDFSYGKGWTFQYNIKYTEDTVPGRKIILWSDGREDRYDSIPGGAYKSPRGFFTKFVQYSTGKFRLTEKDSTTYFFDDPSHKKVTRMQDPNGNYIQFSYTGNLLSSLVNNAGQTISFAYDGTGRLASVVDVVASPARTFTYKYDA
jgi:YD repeat-containing protein